MSDPFGVCALNLLARRQAILCAVVVPGDQVLNIAQQADLNWAAPWPRLAESCRKRERIGTVYLARCYDTSIKIGFTSFPEIRIQTQRLQALVFFTSLQMSHEFWLQGLFEAERVEREFFSGPLIERFVKFAVLVGAVRYGEFPAATRVARGVRALGGIPAVAAKEQEPAA